MARASLLTALLDLPPEAILALTAGAAAFSRALMVDLLSTTRPARSQRAFGAGGPAHPPHGLRSPSPSAGSPRALRPTTFLSWKVALLALAAAGLALGAVRALAMRKIGGQTGDVCGAAQVMAETAMLAVFAAAVSGI